VSEEERDLVEFRWLDSKPIGSDTVVFRREDGATVKIKVDVDKAGVAVNYTNPDGSPHYHVNTSLKVTVIPPKRRYYLPRSQVAPAIAPKKKKKRRNIVI